MQHRLLQVNANGIGTDILLPWDQDSKNLVFLQTGFYKNPNAESSKWACDRLAERIQSRLAHLDQVLSILEDGTTIIDIGAGNSILDVAIAKRYASKNFNFVLVDGNDANPLSEEILSSIKGIHYTEDRYSTYNNWSYAKETINVNLLAPKQFQFIDTTQTWQKDSCDLIMSVGSCGWHYSTSVYLDRITNALKPGGFLYLSPIMYTGNNFNNIVDAFGDPVFIEEIEFDKSKHNLREYDILSNKGKSVIDKFACHAIWRKRQ